MSALDIQIGGEHYKNAKIQPIQYIEANGLGFLEGCVVKRITRHDKPTGKGRQDIEKAIHELQLLLEFRYPHPKHPDDIYSASPNGSDALRYGIAMHNLWAARREIRTETNPPGEDIYAEFVARYGSPTTFRERVNAVDKSVQRAVEVCLARGAGLPAEIGETCPECGYPTDAAGTHYATCSQLTAPEEYKAEAQVAFDEAAELSEALARQVSAGKIDIGFDWGSAVAEEEALIEAEEEPAAAMDDDSPRMQAIGQNGNTAEHYEDPWAGAPEWAKYKAQDANGQWYWYEDAVYASGSQWVKAGEDGRLDAAEGGKPNPNWRDTLTPRT